MARTLIKNKYYKKALLVGFKEGSLEELQGLSVTLGIQIDGTMIFKYKKPHPASLLSKGRLGLVRAEVEKLGSQAVMWDCDLTPAQFRNLEEYLRCLIVDRTELIMQIFALHAKTSQAKLQIEIAQLRYLLPRLRSMWTHFSRIKGGIKGRGGFGEQQLEIDRRRVNERVYTLERKLKDISGRKEREVKSRKECFKVALVGYTNVGKSSLLNRLTGADVLVDDKLFATLDTVTRRLKEEEGVSILLTDTVGFIRNLPHHLIASFHATLTEVKDADLLVYVMDAAFEDVDEQISVIEGVLSNIGVHQKPHLLVFNKVDTIKERHKIRQIKERYAGAHFVSAARRISGLKKFKQRLTEEAKKTWSRVDITLDFSEAGWLEYFKKNSKIIRLKYVNDGIRISSVMSPSVLNHFYRNRN